MKALKFTSIMKTEYVDIEIPEIGDDQVLIKVEAVGICHSDIMALQGKHPYRIPPVITGGIRYGCFPCKAIMSE